MNKKTIISVSVAIVVIVAGVAFYKNRSTNELTVTLRTTEVVRGDLVSVIEATGTLQPEDVMDIGAQVTGKVMEFGLDPKTPSGRVDFCSEVKKGQVLAKIDDTYYKAEADQAEAALALANANLLQYQAKLLQTKNEWERAKSLLPDKAIAQTDFDTAVANYYSAEANVAVGKAAIRQAQAALDTAKTNLGYTVITSPVDGTIIKRRVNLGQTVVSNMSASSFFLIAKDLRRLQVWVTVNEAYIGSVQVGMPARFTVDAYPGELFQGKVIQKRLSATMSQNVVTYTVVVETDNSSLRLLPYLTAKLQFEVESRKNVLKVPNPALRWKPKTEQIAPDARTTVEEENDAKIASVPTEKSNAPKLLKAKTQDDEKGRVWVQDGDYVRPISVIVGPTDGANTVVSGEKIKEGMEIVVNEAIISADGGNLSNPFLPKFPSRKKK